MLRFAIELSLKFGIPYDRLLEELSPEVFYTYVAFFSMKPIDTEGFYATQMMWQNAQSKTKKKLQVRDFMFDWFKDRNKKESKVTIDYVMKQMQPGMLKIKGNKDG